jgi:hypothetical protein
MTAHIPPPAPSTLDGYRYRRCGPVELYLGDAARVLARRQRRLRRHQPTILSLRDYGTGQWAGGDPACPHRLGRARRTDQVRRVLAPTGTCWVKLGDSYSAGTRLAYDTTGGIAGTRQLPAGRRPAPLPAKNLIGVPWRAAFTI